MRDTQLFLWFTKKQIRVASQIVTVSVACYKCVEEKKDRSINHGLGQKTSILRPNPFLLNTPLVHRNDPVNLELHATVDMGIDQGQ